MKNNTLQYAKLKILNCRTVEAFLKKGITQHDAQERWAEYEERRKRNVETVLKDLMLANSRTNYRKTTSVLNRLTMQHDERMLKTAFKQPGRQNLMSAVVNHRRFGSNATNNTPLVKKSYDLQGPDLDRFNEIESKYVKV